MTCLEQVPQGPSPRAEASAMGSAMHARLQPSFMWYFFPLGVQYTVVEEEDIGFSGSPVCCTFFILPHLGVVAANSGVICTRGSRAPHRGKGAPHVAHNAETPSTGVAQVAHTCTLRSGTDEDGAGGGNLCGS